jgi:hypothetical protein
MSGLTDEQQARVDALAAKGWTLVTAPSVDEQHAASRLTASYVMERTWNGRMIRENAHDLDTLLEMTEWQERRLRALPPPEPVQVHTGASSTAPGEC